MDFGHANVRMISKKLSHHTIYSVCHQEHEQLVRALHLLSRKDSLTMAINCPGAADSISREALEQRRVDIILLLSDADWSTAAMSCARAIDYN